MAKKLLLLLFGLLFLIAFKPVRATDIDTLNAEIAGYEAQVKKLQSQANTLSNQIAQFNAQIKLTELKIAQTQERIELLGGRIDQLESSLQSLTKAFSARTLASYKMAKTGEGLFMLLNTQNLGDFVSKYHHLQRIMVADQSLLVRLQGAQNTYKTDKSEQEKLEVQLETQKKSLATQKAAKDQLLLITRNDEKKYQQLLAQARAQLAAFRRFVGSQGGATLLNNQTKCDGWGCYYNQRDSQWGNMAIGNSDSPMKEYGCLITSMAMVASHYGKGIKPSEIAATQSVFFGNTAYMIQGSWSASGISMSRTRVCSWCGESTARQKIDEEINAGRPVIVGLYSGPDHFIVIKGKSGDNYIMNDPFLENGADKPLTDKYSVSNISTVDVVRVN